MSAMIRPNRRETDGGVLPNVRTRANDLHVDIEAGEHAAIESSRMFSPNPYVQIPNAYSRIPDPQPNREPRRAARHRLASHQHAYRLGAFDHSLQPQPRRKWQSS